MPLNLPSRTETFTLSMMKYDRRMTVKEFALVDVFSLTNLVSAYTYVRLYILGKGRYRASWYVDRKKKMAIIDEWGLNQNTFTVLLFAILFLSMILSGRLIYFLMNLTVIFRCLLLSPFLHLWNAQTLVWKNAKNDYNMRLYACYKCK